MAPGTFAVNRNLDFHATFLTAKAVALLRRRHLWIVDFGFYVIGNCHDSTPSYKDGRTPLRKGANTVPGEENDDCWLVRAAYSAALRARLGRELFAIGEWSYFLEKSGILPAETSFSHSSSNGHAIAQVPKSAMY